MRSHVPVPCENVPAPHQDGSATLAEEMSFAVLIATVSAYEAQFGADQDWSRDAVEERLEDAIKLAHRTAGRVGPRGYGSAMPAYLYSELDLWYQQTQEAEERSKGDRQRNRIVRSATTHEIAQMEQALEWPKRYVANEVVRKALHLWMLSKAVRVPFKRVLKGRGIAHRTGIDRKDRAIALIVYGLVADKVLFIP